MSGIMQQTIDTRKIFIGDNRMRMFTYTNGTGDEVTLAKGQLMGYINSSLKVTPAVSTATDGSQVGRFILANNYTVADGDSVSVQCCVWGDVDQDLIVFSESGSPLAAEDLDTVISVYNSGATNSVIKGTNLLCLLEVGIWPRNVAQGTYQDNTVA